MSKGKAVFGTMIGLAAGTLVGILMAPEKGSALRRQIRDKSDSYLDELKSKFDELFDSLSKRIEHTKNDAEVMAGKGKSEFESFKKDAKNAASDVGNSGY